MEPGAFVSGDSILPRRQRRLALLTILWYCVVRATRGAGRSLVSRMGSGCACSWVATANRKERTVTRSQFKQLRRSARRERINTLTKHESSGVGQVLLLCDKRRRQFERILRQLPEHQRRAIQYVFWEEVTDLVLVFCFEAARAATDPLRRRAGRVRHPWPILARATREEVDQALRLS